MAVSNSEQSRTSPPLNAPARRRFRRHGVGPRLVRLHAAAKRQSRGRDRWTQQSLFLANECAQLKPLMALETDTDIEKPFHCYLTWRWSLSSPSTGF
uniref:Uncharacterized protein n=1 Tax=Peronospora matthiolae TaxID=2874970 RepID=A0AAV1UV56_9STRA